MRALNSGSLLYAVYSTEQHYKAKTHHTFINERFLQRATLLKTPKGTAFIPDEQNIVPDEQDKPVAKKRKVRRRGAASVKILETWDQHHKNQEENQEPEVGLPDGSSHRPWWAHTW